MLIARGLTDRMFPVPCSVRFTPLTEREACLAAQQAEAEEGLRFTSDLGCASLSETLGVSYTFSPPAAVLRVGDRVLIGPHSGGPWVLTEVTDDAAR